MSAAFPQEEEEEEEDPGRSQGLARGSILRRRPARAGLHRATRQPVPARCSLRLGRRACAAAPSIEAGAATVVVPTREVHLRHRVRTLQPWLERRSRVRGDSEIDSVDTDGHGLTIPAAAAIPGPPSAGDRLEACIERSDIGIPAGSLLAAGPIYAQHSSRPSQARSALRAVGTPDSIRREHLVEARASISRNIVREIALGDSAENHRPSSRRHAPSWATSACWYCAMEAQPPPARLHRSTQRRAMQPTSPRQSPAADQSRSRRAAWADRWCGARSIRAGLSPQEIAGAIQRRTSPQPGGSRRRRTTAADSMVMTKERRDPSRRKGHAHARVESASGEPPKRTSSAARRRGSRRADDIRSIARRRETLIQLPGSAGGRGHHAPRPRMRRCHSGE